MGAAYLNLVRRTATAWTDVLVDMERRWARARAGVCDPAKAYGTNELVRDAVGVWLMGLQAWERIYMPGATQPVPVILIKGQSTVGEAAIAPVETTALECTDLGHLGAGSPIPHTEVHASVNASGTLRVVIDPKPARERATGLYRGVVFTTTPSGPSVVADVVFEVSKVEPPASA
jgi:hypothetical protein